MKNLQRIAAKKNPTGEELGRLKVANNAYTYRQKLEGHTPKYIISPEDLKEKVQKLTPDQRAIYDSYNALGEFIDVYYNVGLSNYQQSQNAYSDLMSYLTEIFLVEDMHAHMMKLPAIMTQVQFEAEKKKGIYKWSHNEDGSLKMWCVADVLCFTLSYYMAKLEKHKRRKNPLQPVKKKYQSEAVTSDTILQRYNAAAGRGYKTLPDGRRSDQMTKAQWKKATLSPKMKKLTGGSLDSAEWQDFNALVNGLDMARARELWETEELPSSDLERKTLEAAGYLIKQDFHIYEEPPIELKKWDIIKDVFVLEKIYPAALGDHADPEAFKEEMHDFVKEFPDLISTLITEIESRKWFDEPIPDNWEDWNKPFISLQAIYDMDYLGMADSVNKNKDVLFPDNERAKLNGVSVLQDFPNSFFDPPTDGNGYYIQPEITHQIDEPYSLEDFYLTEENETSINNVERSREALIDSYYYIKGFNELLQMISDYYSIPGLEIYRLMREETEDRINGMNEIVMRLYHQVYNTDYGEGGDIIKYMKLEALKKVFDEIKCNSIDVPVKNKTLMKQFFDNMIIFDLPELIEDLMLYRTLRPDSPLQGVL